MLMMSVIRQFMNMLNELNKPEVQLAVEFLIEFFESIM